MSGPRDTGAKALEVEDDAEDQQIDAQGGDEGDDDADPDDGDDLEGSAAAGEDGDDHRQDDALGTHEGNADRSADVGRRKGNPEFGRLRARAREAEERAKRLEDALLARPQTGNAGPDLAAQAARARQEKMDEARERERLGEVGAVARVTEQHLREDFDGRLQGIQFQMAETADRADYRALCAENPLAVKYRAEVEQRLADERRRGLNFPRETVLKFIVGERALQGGGRALTAQRKKAESGIRREKVDAPRGTQRSDVSAGGGRGNDAAARAKRLENIEL